MLRITDSASSQGAKEYFDTSLKQADYYAEGQEIVGLWHGEAAKRLGLSGPVTREAFQALIENRHPHTGEQLTPRMKADRRPGTDFTFNAPKSVSLLYALHKDERIVDGFRRAVVSTMAEVEADVKTRVRNAGQNEDRVSGNLAWAEFLHTTARPVGGVPDPHLHIHAYVPNLTFDKDEGRWKALQLGDTKADGSYYEAAFLSRLAIEMRALGYDIERHGRFWDIAGIPRDLIERFSRRTMEIERTAAEKGITDAERKSQVGARTREKKAEDLTVSELRDVWISRLGPRDRRSLDLATVNAEQRPIPLLGKKAEAALDHAVRHGFERASVVRERHLLASALHHAYGDSGPERIKAGFDRLPLIRKMVEGRALVTSHAVLAEEKTMLDFARSGRLTCRPLGPKDYALRDGRLNEGQRKAVTHVLSSPDQLMILRGGAGTGKTTLMGEAIGAIAAGGKHVAVFAPTSAACDVLRKEGFDTADTLQRLLIDADKQQGLKGAVLWVDEAGLISIPDMAKLTRIAEEHSCRVILSGDSRQHSAVTRGDALRLLETRAGIPAAEVTDIVRQRGAYRDAVADISAGHVEAGFKRFDEMGSIIELDGKDRLTKLAADYCGEVKAGRSVLVVSPTHAEKNAVTADIRKALLADGRLGKDTHIMTAWRDVGWTEAQRGDAGQYQGGEWVKFIQNTPDFDKGTRSSVTRTGAGNLEVKGADGTAPLPLTEAARFKVYRPEPLELRTGDAIRITENGQSLDGHKLINGAVYHVGGFDADGHITLAENRWKIARDFGHIDHGYCSTSVSSQGRTVDTVLVAMGADSAPAMSSEQFYVTVSRGRHAMRLYTDDREAIAEAVLKSGARGSASELVDGGIDRKAKPAEIRDRLESTIETAQRLASARVRQQVKEAEVPPKAAGLSTMAIEHQGMVSSNAAETRRG